MTASARKLATLVEQLLADAVIRQHELLPDATAKKTRRFSDTPINPDTRKFGKFIDTSLLLPGDLILIRDMPEASGDSRLTVQVQTKGGYAPEHARWTHVAMYLGKDQVIEATTDSYYKGDVRKTHLDKYCTGQFAMRIRRPLGIANEDRHQLCMQALTRLRMPYGFWAAASLWFYTFIKKRLLRDHELALAVNRSVICSTLYTEAFAEVTNRIFPKHAGACVPALLSGSDLLEDVEAVWVKIA